VCEKCLDIELTNGKKEVAVKEVKDKKNKKEIIND
jgi:hypothetical protein